mgnify:CR=1 FL=1
MQATGVVRGLKELGAADSWVAFDMASPNSFELKARSNEPYELSRCQVGFAVEDIDDSRRELIAREVEPVTEIVGSVEVGSYWCYFKDPEGDLLAIREPTDSRKLRKVRRAAPEAG